MKYYSDKTVLIVENEKDLQKLINKFNVVCERRKLNLNVGKKLRTWFFRKSYIIQHDNAE